MLSFIIPAYNCADVVEETVESVVAQRVDSSFEIVAVEDGSTDDTAQVLERLSAAHPNLRVIRHDRNRGEGAARNTAIHAAEGELLYMIDADNVLPPDAVQPQLDLLRSGRWQAVSVARLVLFEERTNEPTGTLEIANHDGVSGLQEVFSTWKSPASVGNYLITRDVFDAVGGYQEGLTMSAWAFGLTHIVRGYDVAIARDTFYFHRVGRPGNWLRGEQLGINDDYGVAALADVAADLPPALRSKAAKLKPGDPLFAWIESGRFRPDAQLPPAPLRAAIRARRRLRAWRRRRALAV